LDFQWFRGISPNRLRKSPPKIIPVIIIGVNVKIKVKVKFSRYRPGVAQRVDRGIAILFRDRGTRRG
jgi:hypothetical protein